MSLLSLKKQATITQVMKDNGGFKVIYNITDINDNSSTNQSTNKED